MRRIKHPARLGREPCRAGASSLNLHYTKLRKDFMANIFELFLSTGEVVQFGPVMSSDSSWDNTSDLSKVSFLYEFFHPGIRVVSCRLLRRLKHKK